MLTIGTDFSGIGAPEQALKKLGIEYKSVFACDYDKYAKQSFLANYNTENWYDDITKRDHSKTPYCDLYVAGFPCQAFSMAGKRKGFNDTSGTLFFDLLKYLDSKKPKYFILENVKGLISHNKGQTFAVILDCLAKTVNTQYSFTMYDEGLGYYIYYKVLNTKDFGLPQNRERVFIVGFRDDNHNFKWPKPFKLEKKLVDMLEEGVDDKFYLSNRAVSKLQIDNSKVSNEKIRVHSLFPRSSKSGKGGTGPLNKEDGTTFCVDTGNSQAIEWVADYRKDEGLRIRKNRMSPCLTTSSTPIIKQRNVRKLTPLECLRLQGFPDSFERVVSDSQLYKQAGNSMTVDVMAAIIKQVLENEN